LICKGFTKLHWGRLFYFKPPKPPSRPPRGVREEAYEEEGEDVQHTDEEWHGQGKGGY
jgi:hypothetical protein